jgi:hypothetical protein
MHMKRFLVSLLIVFSAGLLGCGIVFCQDDQAAVTKSAKSQHALGASVGVNDFHIKDEYLSPIIFSGLTLSSRVSYQLQLPKTRHAIAVMFSVGSIDSDIQPRDVTQYVGYVSYSFTREFKRSQIAGRPLKLSLGSGLSTFASTTDFIAKDKTWDYQFADESWYWYHAANLHLRGDYQFSQSQCLSLQITSPLARLVTRPENGHYFNASNANVLDNFWNAASGGEMEFLWDNFALFSEFEYRQSLNNRLDLRATYWFGYASSSRPFKMLSTGFYMNQFLVGIYWRF